LYAIGGQNTTTYKYGNAKVNVKGRVNLGFGLILGVFAALWVTLALESLPRCQLVMSLL
jgi:uncharacterized membrane protein